ncbi:unnamed protein product [Heligmosomoides polygyrus]|uniref:Gag-like protein n=1 Tax=Heligmosomoides polygyrus TaxID=6339 RepID=A0A183GGQ9_HELPZ|nr:unnamed protein product [Heligmosomoides polygyrus]
MVYLPPIYGWFELCIDQECQTMRKSIGIHASDLSTGDCARVHLRTITFTNEMQEAALSNLDQCDSVTLLAYIISRFEGMEELMRANATALKIVLERSAPTSACAFCSVEENRDGHFTGRCTRFPDFVSRMAQASRLLVCLRYLKPSHQDDFGMKCRGCALGHNSLPCTQRRAFNGSPMKRHRN